MTSPASKGEMGWVSCHKKGCLEKNLQGGGKVSFLYGYECSLIKKENEKKVEVA